jgi:NAD(P)-dependent dehydrogenase (short-subunit alcohol dehydrogenase family)
VRQELRSEILDPGLSIDGLNALCARFIRDTEEAGGDYARKGWPNTTYGVSKAAVHALTRILAQEQRRAGRGVTVNACCPGWCQSDMAGYERPPKTAEQGADTPVWLALLQAAEGEDAPNGRFFSERTCYDW